MKFLKVSGIIFLVIILLWGFNLFINDENKTEVNNVEMTANIEKPTIDTDEEPASTPTLKPTLKPTEKPTVKPTKAPTEKPMVTVCPTSTPYNQNKTKDFDVYVTPTGKRYHYISSCAGKNATLTSLSCAEAMGFTPCKKCT